MKDDRPTISVQLVPMADEDKVALRDAVGYLYNLGRLLGDDWEGWKTIDGLRRLEERVGLSMPYDIPVPMSQRTKQPLFIGETEEV